MDGVHIFELFVEQLFDESQLLHLFQSQTELITSSVVHDHLNKLLTKRANFQIFSSFFLLFELKIEFKTLFKNALQLLSKILSLQKQRGNVFNVIVTQSYNLKYSNCIYNTIIENKANRSFAVFCYLHANLIDKQVARNIIKEIKEQNQSEHALLFHINKLLG